MKRTLLLLLMCLGMHVASAQVHIPTRAEVGAAVCPTEIAPIEAPFYMPEMERPTFPDYTVRVACPTNGDMATRAIQKAIDQTAKRGGGRVIVPAGHWHTGRITLKSNVNLHLEEGCELHFSGEIEDYLPAVFTTNEGVEIMSLGACVYACDAENIALTGKGRLIGPKSGSIKDRQVSFSIEKIDFNTPVEERIYDGKDGGEVFLPTFFGPINCKKVFLEGVRFEQGFFWNIAPVYCEELIIRGVEVESVGIPRGDGIDITCCKYVLIEYSTMSCGDDNFAMKGGRNEYGEAIGRASENIVMRRCLTLRGHGGITCGSETAGWIRNLYTHDCVFDGTQVGIRFKTRRPRAGGGENLTYERIRMNTTKGAIVWDMLGNPAWIGALAARKPAQRWTKLTPAFRAITIRDVVVEGCRELIDMKAIPESPVRYLQIENLTLDMSRTKSDPSNRRLMLLRDVEGMSMRNFRMIGAKKPLIEVVDGRNLIFENWQTEGITPEVQYEGDLTGDIRFYNCPGWEAFSR